MPKLRGTIKVGGKTYTAKQWRQKQHPVTKQPSTTTTTRKRTLAPKRMLPVRKATPILPIKAKPVMKQPSTTTTTIKRIEDIGAAAGKALRRKRRQYKLMETW